MIATTSCLQVRWQCPTTACNLVLDRSTSSQLPICKASMHVLRQISKLLASCACFQQSLTAVATAAAAEAGEAAASASSISRICRLYNLGLRTLSSSAATQQAYRHEETPDRGDSYYWVPSAEEQQAFTFDRSSIADRRATGRPTLHASCCNYHLCRCCTSRSQQLPYSHTTAKTILVAAHRSKAPHVCAAAGRLESALESVLLADGNLREQLVFKYGFSIHRVQLSKDRRTVFILWDASPGKAQVQNSCVQRPWLEGSVRI